MSMAVVFDTAEVVFNTHPDPVAQLYGSACRQLWYAVSSSDK